VITGYVQDAEYDANVSVAVIGGRTRQRIGEVTNSLNPEFVVVLLSTDNSAAYSKNAKMLATRQSRRNRRLDKVFSIVEGWRCRSLTSSGVDVAKFKADHFLRR